MIGLLAILPIVTECRLIKEQREFQGPFEAAESAHILTLPMKIRSVLFVIRSDTNDAPRGSHLRLWVNGAEYDKPHTGRWDAAALGAPGAFTNWYHSVVFSLPEGGRNDAGLTVRVSYPLQFGSRWIAPAWLAGSLALIIVLFQLRVPRPVITAAGRAARTLLAGLRIARLHAPVALAIPARLTRWLIWSLALLSLAYGASAIWAYETGWALPTTAAIRLSGAARILVSNLPNLAPALLCLAMAGCAAGWTARLLRVDETAILAAEAQAARTFNRAGLPILLAVGVLTISAVWTGMPNRTGATVMGLVPFSDAHDYYAGAVGAVRDGYFNTPGARRPIAQSLRTSLYLLAGSRYSLSLILQAVILALAGLAAAAAVIRWHGIWAGLAFLAMIYAAGWEFAPTSMTEPLGLFWGLLAIPPILEAIRGRSLGHAMFGLAILTIALLVRMGSMFTIPAFLLWIVWRFGRTRRGRVALAASGIGVLLAVMVLNTGSSKLYTRDAALVGSNFSFTLCGLTIGESWDVCDSRYRPELPAEQAGSEVALTNLMYRKALENFEAHPGILIHRLADGMSRFVQTSPLTMTIGYTLSDFYYPAWLSIFLVFCAFGLVREAVFSDRRDLLFWTLMAGSVLVSSGMVYFDDGRRTMIAIYPLIALFLATGLARPVRIDGHPVALPFRAVPGALLASAILASTLVAPALAHAFRPSYFPASARPKGPPWEFVIFGGKQISGVLVLADDEALPTTVPSIHISAFEQAVRGSGVESYQQLVTPEHPPLPFAFITAPVRRDHDRATVLLIVPPEVLTRTEVGTWRLHAEEFGRKPPFSSYWFRAIDAEAIDDPPDRR